MSAPVFLLALSILLAFGVFVIRILMRREYERRGALSKPASFLFTAVFFGIGFFIWFDLWAGTPPPLLGETAWRIGWVLFSLGLAGMVGMMIWLGIRRSFGVQTKGLNQSGPYRYSRNPQTVVCSLIMISFALFWPSWHAFGWLAVYFILVHLVVITEEEHLQRVFGEEYKRYCHRTPRYLGLPRVP